MSGNPHAYTVKLEAAYRAGHSGDQAVEFASLIQGDTVDEAQEHAERLARVLASVAATQEPKPDRAVDHSQGLGTADDVPVNDPLNDFRDTMRRVLR